MRHWLIFHFLTLVLSSLAWAAPNNDFEPPPVDVNPVKKEKPAARPSKNSEAVSPTEIKAPEHLHLGEHKTWTQATNVLLGYTDGIFDKDNKKSESSFTFGVERTMYTDHDTANEFGLQLNNLGLLGVDWGYKWLITSAEAYEPFYKLGVAAYYDPSDGLANVVDYQRYLVRGSIGAENLFRSFRRLKAEAGVGAGPLGLSVFANLIYAFPD
jgi:hypothetical protein